MPIKLGKTSQHHKWPRYMDWSQIGRKVATKQRKEPKGQMVPISRAHVPPPPPANFKSVVLKEEVPWASCMKIYLHWRSDIGMPNANIPEASTGHYCACGVNSPLICHRTCWELSRQTVGSVLRGLSEVVFKRWFEFWQKSKLQNPLEASMLLLVLEALAELLLTLFKHLFGHFWQPQIVNQH